MKSNTIILIVATLVVAAGAYWYFFTDTGNQPPISADTAVESGAQLQFKALASQLQSITFDTGIFGDPRFKALVDITTPVASETLGRSDPLAPIAGVSPVK